jgi:hypothetical protein
MGYEIKMIVGRSTPQMSDEWARSKTPYKDLSGFEPKRDSKGNIVRTGRKLQWFMPYAEINLCKIGYREDDPLNKLIDETHQKVNAGNKNHAFYFYGIDGNIEQTADRYGQKFLPVPVKTVLHAMKASQRKSEPYRRLAWAIALLEAMKDDAENLEVIFYGH